MSETKGRIWAKTYLAGQKKRKVPTFLDLEKLKGMRWGDGEALEEAELGALITALRQEDDKHEVAELRLSLIHI